MAITTLSQYKLIKGITGTAQDAQIEALIPLVESDYLNIRNRPFDTGVTIKVTTGATVSGDLEFTAAGSTVLVAVDAGDSVPVVAYKIGYILGGFVQNAYRLSGYVIGAYTPFVRVVGDTVTIETVYDYTLNAGATGVTVTISTVGNLYPEGSEMVAINMVHWMLSGGGQSAGVASESLGKYSVSYDTGQSAGGYPKSITGAIKRYVTYK